MPGKELMPRAATVPATVDHAPWAQEQGKRQSEAAHRRFGRQLRRNRHITVPIAVPPIAWIAALMLHHYHCTGFVLLVGVLASGFIAYFAPHKWAQMHGGQRRPNRKEVFYADASAGAASLWLWLATWLGPISGLITASVLGGLLIAGSVAWGIPWYKHKRPRGRRRHERMVAAWNAWWQSHCWNWGLGGSGVVDVAEMGVTVKLTIQGVAGRHSIQHVTQVMHLIESAADGHADIGMIRAEAVRGKPSQFHLFLKRENPLQAIIAFDPALAPRSVHEPIPDGITETGNWKMLNARKNRFVIGETRSGKSNDLLVGIACLSGCVDDRPIVIDLKGGRSARPVLKAAAAEYVVTEIDEARLLLRMLAAEAIARAKHAYTGDEQLHATAEIPALHVLIDEVHGLTSTANGDAECSRQLALVTSQGAGLEIYVWVYTQHGSLEESVRTEQTRANLHVRSVYRVAEARHGAYAIPEYHKLDASRLDEKGTHYIKDGRDALPEQVRAPHMPHDLLVKIATGNLAQLGDRPPLTLYCGSQVAYGTVTWQQWWDSRWERLDEAFRKDSPQYQQYAAMLAATSPAAAFTAASQVRSNAVAAAEPVAANAPGEGNGVSAAARMNEEVADQLAGIPEDWTPPNPKRVNLQAVIQNEKERFAAAIAGAPPQGVSPKQLGEQTGRAKTWIHDQLTALSDAGAVTRVGHGRYAPVPGIDITEAMEAIEDGNRQLFRQAKTKINAA